MNKQVCSELAHSSRKQFLQRVEVVNLVASDAVLIKKIIKIRQQ